MTVLTVAKKDFRDAVQSRALWGLIATFVLLSMFSSYAYVSVPQLFGEPGGATFAGLVMFTVGLTGLFVPLAAIVVCYKSVAGERELGSIKLLLSLPTTRRAVFAGKVIGRAVVLSFGLGVGLLIGLGFGGILLGTVDPVVTLGFLFVTLVFATAYASIMVSLSAITGSTTRATTLALGFFVIFELFWDAVPLAILYVIGGFSLPTQMPDWVYPITQLSPSSAYLSSVITLFPDLMTETGSATVEATAMSADPFYFTPAVGLVALVFWLVAPLLVGYVRFNSSDL